MKTNFVILLLTVIGLTNTTSSIAQQWSVIGNENQISSVASVYTSITVLDNVPYIVYVEGTSSGGTGKVKRKNLTSGAWEQVGPDLGTNMIYTRIYSDNSNQLYVTFINVANGNRLAVLTFNTTTQTWEPLIAGDPHVSTGTVTYSISQFSSTPRSGLAFDNNNVPYITYSERATNGNAYVKRFTGGVWETVGGGPVAAGDTAVANNIALDYDNVPYVVYVKQSSLTSTAGKAKVYRFNDTTSLWVDVSPPDIVAPGSSTTGATTGTRHTFITMDSIYNPIVSYFNTSNSNRSTIIRYNRQTSTWNYVGTTSTRDVPYSTLIRDNGGNVYNTFTDLLVNGGTSPMIRVNKLGYAAPFFTELKNSNVSRGIDSGNVSHPNLAVGSDTSKAYLVYTYRNSSSVTVPIVQMYSRSIITKPVSNIGTNSATSGGDITYDGGFQVTERGIVYGNTINPTTANTKITDASVGTGAFTISLTGLTPDANYYVRAYFINSAGTTYGNNINFTTLRLADAVVTTPKQMEYLNRGVVAARVSPTKVFVSWRLWGTEPASTSFNIYRDGIKLNTTPITASTNYEDLIATNGMYTVAPIINGVEGSAATPVPVWANSHLYIPMQIPPGGTTPDNVAYTYSANDASVGDVDGDGEYEIFVKWDPSQLNHNSGGYSGNQIIDCYKMNGTRLWRINLGKNINAGPHFTQFMVYDLDGDGKAEMACKTADGTIDGAGVIIGNPTVDYRNSGGWVHSGPEFLTVFNGQTGAALATVNYEPARGNISDWGDNYGNRADRFISAIAYLDGARPSLIIGRGYYNKLARAAYDFRNGQLTFRWVFSSTDAGNSAYAGMGNHQMTIGDADGDGKDEIFNGSSAINDNGSRFWSNGYGHGDALHMTDMDPDRAGQEMWICLESPSQYTPFGLRFNDAKTGSTIWGVPTTGDVGRAMAADIDPAHRGYEVWGSSGNLYTCKGVQIATTKPSYNFGIWWDGDLSRELLDGNVLDKWNPSTNSMNRMFTIYNAAPVSSNNSTKKNPCLMADLLGDWREEILMRTSDNTALVLFTTTMLTQQRIFTLMHDPQYRTAIAWQNSGYNQPPYPSFYLGHEMAQPALPNIYLAGWSVLPVNLLSFNATAKDNHVLVDWSAASEIKSKHYVVERSADGIHFAAIKIVKDKGNTGIVNNYFTTDYHPLDGINYYRLKQVDVDGKFVHSEIKTVKFAKAKQLTIYPNPATSNITLNLPGSSDNLLVTVRNIEGKLVYNGKGSLGKINHAINNLLPVLTPGNYYVELRDGDGVYRSQLIKQ